MNYSTASRDVARARTTIRHLGGAIRGSRAFYVYRDRNDALHTSVIACHPPLSDDAVLRCLGGENVLCQPVSESEDHSAFVGLATDASLKNEELARELTLLAAESLAQDFAAADDPAIGVPDRVEFVAELASALGGPHAERVAALVVDVDHFHRVIARFGDAGGEALMHILAARMASSLPEGVFLARVGGDRFGVVLSVGHEGHPEVSALVAAADIQTAFRESVCVADEEIFVTASIGVALGGRGGSAAQLLHDTDLAVAIAKRAGGSATRVFRAGMNNQLAFQLLRERDVRLAVNRDEFAVFFQPIVDVGNGQLHAFEALLRWRNPEEGLLPPSTFVDVLEETRLIEVVGRRVIRESCRQAARWLEQTGTLAPVSVNVAPLQLNAADFCDHVGLCLDEFQLPGAALIVELTENAFIADKAGVRDALTRLRAMGVHVYIDDFGTGYSALAYLHELPVTGVKLDRRWFRSIDTLADQREIVRLIVELAHRMAIDVVVEGIETRSQLETAQRLGCDFAQGYWFARPLDPDQASEYLAALTPTRTSTRAPAPPLLPTWAENARRRLQDWMRSVSIAAFGTHAVRFSVSP